MRFSFASAFALSSLFLGAFAAPAGDLTNPTSLVQSAAGSLTQGQTTTTKNTTVSQGSDKTVFSYMETVYSNVQEHTGAINKTISGYNADTASDSEKKNVITVVKTEVKSIVSILVQASVEIGKIGISANVDVSGVVSLVVKLLVEIISTLLNVVSVLGTTINDLLGNVLTLLVHAVTQLLSALVPIVGDVVKTVFSIVSGLIPAVGDVLVGLGELLQGEGLLGELL
ncbi:hypothetical protein BKA81DRAFT_403501 [Phyllosticta paracitricarpa]|uniref:Uncharacterized protein n=1 Tax=Phyllosticta paracitricarpa TaxID=2016321 RepID=A0ABR1N991_9PEZI